MVCMPLLHSDPVSYQALCCYGAGLMIPPALAKHLESKPLVRRWMVNKLGATDKQSGAPAITQKCSNPVTATTSIANHLQGVFNCSASFPDVTVLVQGQEILVHKLFIANACKVLEAQWRSAWDQSEIVTLDCQCQSCQIAEVSHATALMFLEFFYSGKVSWPEGAKDSMTAAELLLLSDKYDVPYLFCEAEIALRSFVTQHTCFDILTLADHHSAEQLSKSCVCYIANMPSHQLNLERFNQLPSSARMKVSAVRVIKWRGNILTSCADYLTASADVCHSQCFKFIKLRVGHQSCCCHQGPLMTTAVH